MLKTDIGHGGGGGRGVFPKVCLDVFRPLMLLGMFSQPGGEM